MSRANFRGLFLVTLVFASFQPSSCVSDEKLAAEIPWPEKFHGQAVMSGRGKGSDAPEYKYTNIPDRSGTDFAQVNSIRSEINHLSESGEELPNAKILQKRIFMSGKGRDAPEELPDAKILQKRIFMSGKGRDAPEELPDAKILQKRIFMSGKKTGGDAPEERPRANIFQKRIFLKGKVNGCDVSESPDNIPDGNEATHERRMFQQLALLNADSDVHAGNLKKLFSLRDHVSAIHEKINDYIDRYRSNDEQQQNAMTGEELDNAQFRE